MVAWASLGYRADNCVIRKQFSRSNEFTCFFYNTVYTISRRGTAIFFENVNDGIRVGRLFSTRVQNIGRICSPLRIWDFTVAVRNCKNCIIVVNRYDAKGLRSSDGLRESVRIVCLL